MGDKYDVFLSYARSDSEKTVELVYRKLCAAGLKPWWDRADMTQRELVFTEEIGKVIRSVDRLVLFIGPNTAASAYVDAEWRYARSVGVKVYPVLYNCDNNVTDRIKLVPARLAGGHVRDISDTSDFERETDKLIADLKCPLSLLSVNHNVPKLPFGYVELGEFIDGISDCLFSSSSDGIGVKRIVSLNGMGGIGKSTVAAAFCCDETVRRAFSDIYWIKLGAEADIRSAWRDIAEELDKPGDLNETEIMRELSRTFADTDCLFVLDDCWHVEIVEFFKCALDRTRNRVLFTSRDLSINNVLGIDHIDIKKLGNSQAKKLLANRCRLDVNELPEACDTLLEKLGGHPLAIAISASMYLEWNDWNLIIDSYYESESEFGMNMPDYGYKNVFLSVSASLKLLSENYRKAFEKLVVFPYGKSIDIGVLGRFVSVDICGDKSDGLAAKTSIFVKKLASKSLIEFDEQSKSVTVHPLILDYLKKSADERRLQNLFLECISGESEDYYYENIIYHLIRAGSVDKAKRVLFDYAYLIKKIEICGVNDLITDLSYFDGDDKELLLFEDFIRLAAPIIRNEPLELVSQLFGRFEYPMSDAPLINSLMQSALCEKKVCFIPVKPCMNPPRTALVNHFSAENKIFGLHRYRKTIVISDKSGQVSLVDTSKMIQIGQFSVDGWVIDAFVHNGCLWVVYDKNKLVLFDIDSGDDVQRYTLDGMYQAHASNAKGTYIGDLTGAVYIFNKDNVLIERAHLLTGISFMRDNNGAIEVYGLNKCVYEMRGTEFVLKEQSDHRVVKADGNAELGYDGILRFNGGTAEGVVDFDSVGNTLGYITKAKRIVALDTSSGAVVKEFVSNNNLSHIVADGDHLYVSDDQNTVDKWDITLEQKGGIFVEPWVTAQAYFDGTRYYAAFDGKVYADGAPIIDTGEWPNGLAASDKYLIFANGINELKIYDRKTFASVCTVNCEKAVTGITCLGSRVYISDGVGTVGVFDLDSQKLCERKKVGSWINSIASFSDTIIVADRYGRIFLLSPDGLEKEKEIKVGEEITSVAAVQTESSRYIAYANQRGVVKLIDLEGKRHAVYHTTISHILSMLYVNWALNISTDLTTEKVNIANLK